MIYIPNPEWSDGLDQTLTPENPEVNFIKMTEQEFGELLAGVAEEQRRDLGVTGTPIGTHPMRAALGLPGSAHP